MKGADPGRCEPVVIKGWRPISRKKLAKDTVFPTGDHRIYVIKVGDDDRPAGPEDLKDALAQFKRGFRKFPRGFAVATHHAVKVEVIPIENLVGSHVQTEAEKEFWPGDFERPAGPQK